ncbi:ACT domain-containing protein [Anaerovorax odorimutans]|uniref:ACT domain-containing protein n=1 Tax=Anaerovorax odorimutans TaxID=109327 RepID=UPI00041D3971|nr:ACT domain-containing protein [Anaerovorax odorimutans]
MIIKQLSVFLQNELGRLEEATDVIYKNNINITALSIAETAEYGILRMIVSDTDKAAEALKECDFSIKITDVICIEVPDNSGELHKILRKLSDNGINLSYMYGYSKSGKAPLILKVSDPKKAIEVLE